MQMGELKARQKRKKKDRKKIISKRNKDPWPFLM